MEGNNEAWSLSGASLSRCWGERKDQVALGAVPAACGAGAALLPAGASVIVARMTRWDAGWCLFLAVWLGVAGACSGDAVGSDDVRDTRDGDVAETRESSWQSAVSGLPGALLSVWGTAGATQIWAVGADARDGTGPMVVRGTAGRGWERVDVRGVDPAGGHLWWVYGPPKSDSVWIVGELGRVLTVARTDGAEPTVTRIESGTDATLYGVWAASEDALWAVGGYVYPRTGPPTIVKLGPNGAEVVALPAGLPASGTFFKVWGAAADDVWVVGEKGMVLHFDGAAWTRVVIAGEPRLVTVHGRNADDVVTVGGTGEGVIFVGRAFEAQASAGLSPLNGVFVEPDGGAWAVGMLGQVLRRAGTTGAWEAVAVGGALRDWHAAWVDDRGDAWVAGGNLLTRLDQGTLLRFGPARGDLPTGEVAWSPSAEVESEDVEVVESEDVEVVESEDVEVVESEDVEVVESEDVEVVESEDGEVVESEDGEVVESEDGEVSEEIEVKVDAVADEEASEEIADTHEVESDSGPDVSDADEADVVLDVAEDSNEVSEGDASSEAPFELGWIDYANGMFMPYAEGATLDLHHGPQGGIHVEVAVRFPCVTAATEVATAMDLHLVVDGVELARYTLPDYPVPVTAGVCQSYAMPLIFDNPDSSLVAGKIARVSVGVKPPGNDWLRVLEGQLVDTF